MYDVALPYVKLLISLYFKYKTRRRRGGASVVGVFKDLVIRPLVLPDGTVSKTDPHRVLGTIFVSVVLPN